MRRTSSEVVDHESVSGSKFKDLAGVLTPGNCAGRIDQAAAFTDKARGTTENLALKLHNFYTGCERIFNVVTSELNGGPPTGYDWHQRLLDRMAADWGERPAIITAATATDLREFLSFRHVVRNVYGYELDPERIERLLEKYPQTWTAFRSDVENFIRQLKTMADLV